MSVLISRNLKQNVHRISQMQQRKQAIRDSLRKIGAAFLTSREVSTQECVYRCMPELWSR